MFRKIKAFLLYDNSIAGDLKSVRKQIMEENRKSAVTWSTAQVLYWVFCLFMATRDPAYHLCRHIYAAALAVCAAALLLAVFAVRRVPWLINPVCLAVDAAFLGAGIAVACHLAPKTIIVFASVLIVPVFFICNTLPTLIILVINLIVMAFAGKGRLDPETYHWTVTNLGIFSSIGLLLGFFVNKARFERFIYADSAVRLAELQTRYAYFDQMTGLRNRRAYSELTDGFAEKEPAYCCVVNMDINGLKETNDRLGHEAGDELIVGSADCIRRGFGGLETIYRIGGDEFCVIVLDAGTDVEECLKRVQEYCAGWKGTYVNGVSLSYGHACSDEFPDFASVKKAADQRMYQFKRNFYMSSGKDRRSR